MGGLARALPQRYFMAFDQRRGMGVQEHFFHFMWGYLLPAAHAIIDMQAGASADRVRSEFVFTSCGPVMDAKTAEMARLLGIECSIVQDEREGRRPGTITVPVQRWDSFLCDYSRSSGLPRRAVALGALRQAAHQRSIPPVIWSRRRIVQEIRRLRRVVLATVPGRDEAGACGEDARCYYILKRSEQPPYYAPGRGGARTPTYGTSRRSLLGIEGAAVALSRESHRVEVFEPGRHTLAEQIRAFRSCRGIIAIRGAELANIVWLGATSKVIVINAGKFQLPAPPARGLAKLLGIDYAEIELGEDCYPALTDELIERIRAHIET
jgi:hypothetical protein